MENHRSLPCVFLFDDVFALKTFMMKLYPQIALTIDKRIYNYRHSRARGFSENLFGILASRWKIFYTMFPLSSRRIKNIILSTLALSNILFVISATLYMYILLSET